MADVLVVDNHDSFVHTLVGYLDELGARKVREDGSGAARYVLEGDSDGVAASSARA